MARWSIGEVARASGVTTRTLRHYDRIGLLPVGTEPNGYRSYGRDELLRLQRILLLRMLGLRLDAIAAVLDGEADEVEALRRHHRALLAERDRFDRLAATVALTLQRLRDGEEVTAEAVFAGFVTGRRDRYEAELVARHGDGVRGAFAEAERRTRGWTVDDHLAGQEEWAGLEEGLLACFRDGRRPDDPAVLELVAGHHAMVSRMWTPTRASYAGLGEHYVEDADLRARLEVQQPGFAAFLRAATVAFARERLR